MCIRDSISDYTREAEKPFAATLSSTLTYGVVSCWMYVIGMGAAIFTGEGDIALIMVKAGLGVAALLILILSTVTTTFLDAYSAGISAESLSKKINGKYAALIVTVIGTVCAICFPMDDITNFLYLIGSVFAPMIAIQIGNLELKFSPRKSPVRAALPSLTVSGSPIAFCHMYSDSTHDAIHTTINTSARIPKL